MAAKALKFLANVVSLPIPRSLFNVLILIGSTFGIFWTFAEAMGISGSTQVGIGMTIVITLMVLLMLGMLWLARWSLIYLATKEQCKLMIQDRVVRETTTLVAVGGGGAIILGMVSKAFQELGLRIQNIIAIDIDYNSEGKAIIGNVLPAKLDFSDQDVFIVLSYVGTGRALRAIKDRFNLNNAKCFSTVVSKASSNREKIDYYLYVGGREIIPWQKS